MDNVAVIYIKLEGGGSGRLMDTKKCSCKKCSRSRESKNKKNKKRRIVGRRLKRKKIIG